MWPSCANRDISLTVHKRKPLYQVAALCMWRIQCSSFSFWPQTPFYKPQTPSQQCAEEETQGHLANFPVHQIQEHEEQHPFLPAKAPWKEVRPELTLASKLKKRPCSMIPNIIETFCSLCFCCCLFYGLNQISASCLNDTYIVFILNPPKKAFRVKEK